jgi:hypothetical protein
MYQHLPLQEPLQFTQIGLLGLKINHLATLMEMMARVSTSDNLYLIQTVSSPKRY